MFAKTGNLFAVESATSIVKVSQSSRLHLVFLISTSNLPPPSEFIDEFIQNDIKCANYLRERHGFNYWKIYQDYCRPPKANGPPNRNIPNLKELNCRLDSQPPIKPILQNQSNGGFTKFKSAENIAKIESELEFIPRGNTINCVRQKSLLLPVKNPC